MRISDCGFQEVDSFQKAIPNPNSEINNRLARQVLKSKTASTQTNVPPPPTHL
jgi:hypothetical protein